MATVVFIHGLSNKPEHEYLLNLWKRKLGHEGGVSLDDRGVESSMVYWANVLYPSADTDLAAYESAASGDEVLVEGHEAVTLAPDKLPPDEAAFVARLSRDVGITADDLDPATLSKTERDQLRYERVPLPAWLRNRLMAKLVRDAHLYFFNKEFTPRASETFRVRDELRKRFMDDLHAVKDDCHPLVVVSHSMGTIIAYDCLMHEDDCPPVDGLITIGSPLGLDEVQDFFPKWKREDGFPSDKLRGPWINIFDRLDLVAGADPRIANDYQKKGSPVIEDLEEPNWGEWRHSISKYLQGKELRARIAKLLKVEWP
ncbi:hypothetical protein [Mesorhizobium escarrei]|uniref:Serine protease, subtilase family n=1 Tax=Mesorhizobium escarrei TaxID=666018 RepID=A0ABM9E267_9HYPH|nr:hypothetical protein [Mesorhizobium escarrei]CAH2402741.1 Serine protease, subtilase family [Mesorhizobium escarrei]